MKTEETIYEGEKDACYHKVKSRYKVWPSAYAKALVKCRKKGAKNWGNSTKKEEFNGKPFQTFQEEAKKCWKGYEKKGTQKLFGKTYNRCVKKEETRGRSSFRQRNQGKINQEDLMRRDESLTKEKILAATLKTKQEGWKSPSGIFLR